MREKLNGKLNQETMILLAADLILLAAVLGVYSRNSFGSDSLIYWRSPEGGIRTWSFHGRYLATALNGLLLHFGISATEHYRICFLFFLVCLALSLVLIQKCFLDTLRNDREQHTSDADLISENTGLSRDVNAAVFIATALIYVNVLFIEYFYFPECFLLFPFAFLGCGLSFACLAKRHYAAGIFWMVFACLFYQMSCIIIPMLYTAWLIMENRGRIDWKLTQKVFLWTAVPLGIGALDLVSTRALAYFGLIERSGKEVDLDIIDAVWKAYTGLIDLLQSSLTLLPAMWLPGLFMAVITVPYFIYCIAHKQFSRALCFVVFHLYMLLITNVLTVMNGGWYYPRMQFTFYIWQAVTLLLNFALFSGKWSRLMAASAVCYLAVHVLFIQSVAADHYVSNALDMLCAKDVVQRIDRYEEETGIHITGIACTTDVNCAQRYPEVVFYRDQVNERAMAIVPYSAVEGAAMPDRHLEIAEMDPTIYQEHFEGRDWDHYVPEEQLVFEGDTLYFCVY